MLGIQGQTIGNQSLPGDADTQSVNSSSQNHINICYDLLHGLSGSVLWCDHNVHIILKIIGTSLYELLIEMAHFPLNDKLF